MKGAFDWAILRPRNFIFANNENHVACLPHKTKIAPMKIANQAPKSDNFLVFIRGKTFLSDTQIIWYQKTNQKPWKK